MGANGSWLHLCSLRRRREVRAGTGVARSAGVRAIDSGNDGRQERTRPVWKTDWNPSQQGGPIVGNVRAGRLPVLEIETKSVDDVDRWRGQNRVEIENRERDRR